MINQSRRSTRLARVWLFALVSLVSACGGSGSQSASTTSGSSTPVGNAETLRPSLQSTSTQRPSASSEMPASERSTATHPKPKSLVWSAPVTRTDGSKLFPGEIDHFKIYFRPAQSSKSFQVIAIDADAPTEFVLSKVLPGQYIFGITTVDTDGLESALSPLVQVDNG